MREASM